MAQLTLERNTAAANAHACSSLSWSAASRELSAVLRMVAAHAARGKEQEDANGERKLMLTQTLSSWTNRSKTAEWGSSEEEPEQ